MDNVMISAHQQIIDRTDPKETTGKNMRIGHSGIAKLQWRLLEIPIMKSEIICGGVEVFGE